MSWRVHLANQAIQSLHVIPTKTPLLVVWTRPTLAHVYELETGVMMGDVRAPVPPSVPFADDGWQDYLKGLSALQTGMSLPYVRAKNTDVLLTDNGRQRLYFQNGRELYFDDEGDVRALPLEGAKRLLAVEFDRQLAHTVAIDESGRLHVFQQGDALGVYDVGLQVAETGRALLAISRGGNQIFASDGQRVVLVGANGKLRKQVRVHYDIGRIACSPSGSLLAMSDRESGVIRAYKGDDLLLTHQKLAIELIASADQVQLLADLPPANAMVGALTAFTQGMMAFTMSGVVCMTDVTYMDELPRVR
jgi:hypothetical protein